MKVVYKFWKNSNSGDLIRSQEFTETGIKGIPIYYYRGKDNIGENIILEGYVEIKEKTYRRESKNNLL